MRRHLRRFVLCLGIAASVGWGSAGIAEAQWYRVPPACCSCSSGSGGTTGTGTTGTTTTAPGYGWGGYGFGPMAFFMMMAGYGF
jgi:hypothetical protein